MQADLHLWCSRIEKDRFSHDLACIILTIQTDRSRANSKTNISHVMRKPDYGICKQQRRGADQPAHLCSLISVFVIRWLDSIMPLVSVSRISRFLLASVAEQAGWILTWSEKSQRGFLMIWLRQISDCSFWSGSTLFVSPSESFGCITVW